MTKSTRIAIVLLASIIVPACALDEPPPTSTTSQSLIEPVCFDVFGDPIYDDWGGECDPDDDPWGGGGGGGGGGGACWPSTTYRHESCSISADPGTASASAQANASSVAESACLQSATFCIANAGPATYNTNCSTLTNGNTSCCSTASVSCSYSFTW